MQRVVSHIGVAHLSAVLEEVNITVLIQVFASGVVGSTVGVKHFVIFRIGRRRYP